MDVIGVGYGRTGTASLRMALELLGVGPCYHMRVVMDRIDRARQWRRIAEGEPADWDEVYAGFRATVDWPGVVYWRQLVAAYPEAKVLLTVRDPDRWYDSVQRTVFRFPMRRHNRLERWAYAFLCRVNPNAAELPVMLDKVLWEPEFEDRSFVGPADRDFAVESFRRHLREVRDHVPADRLLVFDVRDGWEPLCRFLDLPVPAEPFPKINETEEFMQDIARRRRAAILPVAGAGIGAMAVGAGVGGAVSAVTGTAAATVVGVAAMALTTVLAAAVAPWLARRRLRRLGIG